MDVMGPFWAEMGRINFVLGSFRFQTIPKRNWGANLMPAPPHVENKYFFQWTLWARFGLKWAVSILFWAPSVFKLYPKEIGGANLMPAPPPPHQKKKFFL